MADAVSLALGKSPELIPGRRGIFDVCVDGKVIFSKKATGRFPEIDEILDLLDPEGSEAL